MGPPVFWAIQKNKQVANSHVEDTKWAISENKKRQCVAFGDDTIVSICRHPSLDK